jgi:CopG family transcriptional regulator / antitoxin EndoAI
MLNFKKQFVTKVSLSEAQFIYFNKTFEDNSKKRSEFIRHIIILYIEERKRIKKIEQMKNGYVEMAAINLEFSEIGFTDDIEELKEYEVKLAECDIPDDDSSEKRRYILC